MTSGSTVSAQNTACDHVKKGSQGNSSSKRTSSRSSTISTRRFASRGRVYRATTTEVRRKELASMVREALDTGDEDENEKLEELTSDFEQLTELLKEVLEKSTSQELMDTKAEFEPSAKLMKEVISQRRCQVKWEVFTVLLCQLSHEVDSAEEECEFACTLGQCALVCKHLLQMSQRIRIGSRLAHTRVAFDTLFLFLSSCHEVCCQGHHLSLSFHFFISLSLSISFSFVALFLSLLLLGL